MTRGRTAGRSLAGRHRPAAAVDPAHALANFEEAPRPGDWTLRSALVRFAQPEPERAGAVLHLVRRLNAALHPLVRAAEQATVTCDRALSIESLEPAADGQIPDPADPYPDARVADLARLARSAPDEFDGALDAYGEIALLTAEEQVALPLLTVALEFDDLADIIAAWAPAAPAPPPIEAVDVACRRVHAMLDDLGVAEETGPPPGARSRSRG